MRRCGKVSIGQAGAGKPVTLADEPADIAQMVFSVASRRPQDLGVGRPPAAIARDEALIDALAHESAAGFGEKLIVEPAHQPANLDAIGRWLGQKTRRSRAPA